MAPAFSTRAATPQSRRTASPPPLLQSPSVESGQDKADDDSAVDKKDGGLCGRGGVGGIFSACRNGNGPDGGGCWLGGLFDACRNPNGTNTTNDGNGRTVSSPRVPSSAHDFTPAFAAARRPLAPAPSPVFGPAPGENKGRILWGGHGGDKGVQEEGDVAIEDLTATFDDDNEAHSNKVSEGGTSRHEIVFARVNVLFVRIARATRLTNGATPIACSEQRKGTHANED